MTALLPNPKENIAEYIIYMYRTENLILSYNLDLDQINKYVITNMTRDPSTHKQLLLLYADIIDQMVKENIVTTGKHLASTQHYVLEMTNLHQQLFAQSEEYQKIYKNAEKAIKEHIELSNNTIKNPVQVCLNAVYGLLLLRLAGKKTSVAQELNLKQFGKVLEFISQKYQVLPRH